MNEIGMVLLVMLGASFAASIVLTRLARAVAIRLGLVDRPDGRRKMHDRVIAVAGGIAVFCTSMMVLVAIAAGDLNISQQFRQHGDQLIGLAFGCLVICIIGVADDYACLRGRYKLLGQIVACMIVVMTGAQVRVISLFGQELDLGLFAMPFTVLFLLGAINSLNLLDGMDGLLGTVGTIVAIAIAVLAVMTNHPVEACIAITLAGALLGFLWYNYPPASIFLGDAGSMLIGLVIGTLAIRSSLKGPATVALAAPTALLVIPIFDTGAAIIRRKLTGRSIFSTDRGHIHHCLLRTGLSRPAILLLVGGLCVLPLFGAIASIAYQNESIAVLSAIVVVCVLVAFRLFGHAEMVLVFQQGRQLAKSLLGARADSRSLEVRLQGSASWNTLWSRLTGIADGLNLRSMALDVNSPAHHEGYHASWRRTSSTTGEEPSYWSAALPLRAYGQIIGHVHVTGSPDVVPVWRKLATLTEVTDDVESVLASATVVPAISAKPHVIEPLLPAGPA